MILHYYYRRHVPLLFYGDLPAWQERKLTRHLEHCGQCREDLRELRRLRELASAETPAIYDEQILQDARGELEKRLSVLSGTWHPPGREPLLHFLFPIRPALAASGGIALLAIGFLAGRFLFPDISTGRPAEDSFPDLRGIAVSHVHLLGGDNANEVLELRFDASRPMVIRGTVSDPAIQLVLARAITGGENPGVRMRAAGSIFPRGDGPRDREIKAALLLALKTDPNDGVRKAAIDALLRYPPDREIRDGLLRVLFDEQNPGLRVAAIKGLEVQAAGGFEPEEGMRKDLKEHLRSEENLFVRARAESILKEK